MPDGVIVASYHEWDETAQPLQNVLHEVRPVPIVGEVTEHGDEDASFAMLLHKSHGMVLRAGGLAYAGQVE